MRKIQRTNVTVYNVAETGSLNSQYWPHDQTERPEGQQRSSDHAHLALHYESTKMQAANSFDATIWHTPSVTVCHWTVSVRNLGAFHSAPPPVGGYHTAGDLATPTDLSVPLHYSRYRTRHVVIAGKTNVLGVTAVYVELGGQFKWHTETKTSSLTISAAAGTLRNISRVSWQKDNLQDWLPGHWE
jgi:hypothetical protein